MTIAGFDPIAEVTADGRSRIAFGRVGVHENDRFAVSRSAQGEILLTPLASIPARELLVWEDERVKTSLLRGLVEASAGDSRVRDDYFDDDDV